MTDLGFKTHIKVWECGIHNSSYEELVLSRDYFNSYMGVCANPIPIVDLEHHIATEKKIQSFAVWGDKLYL